MIKLWVVVVVCFTSGFNRSPRTDYYAFNDREAAFRYAYADEDSGNVSINCTYTVYVVTGTKITR